MVGAELTGKRPPADFRSHLGQLFELSLYHQDFWHRLMVLMKPLLWPYAVGSMLCAMVLAAAAYQLALAFLTSRRRLQEIIHHQKH
jgi:hypothetical protein